jgi:PST family polysaccharide transporter
LSDPPPPASDDQPYGRDARPDSILAQSIALPPSGLAEDGQPSFVGRLVSHPVVQNAAALYGVQFAGYVLPLVSIPYLARVLGPAGLGYVAIAQGFGAYIRLVVEFGFDLSATRAVATNRDDQEEVARLLSAVIGAKVVLIVAVVVVAGFAQLAVPIFRDHPLLLWWGVFSAVAQASDFLWFHQALERVVWPAVIDIGLRAMGVLAIFFVIHHPGDAPTVLALQGAGAALSALVLLALGSRAARPRLPRRREVTAVLRDGAGVFLFKGAVTLYTSGNAFLLGLLSTPDAVGVFSGADRLSRAVLGVYDPFAQALYPRMSRLVAEAPDRAAQAARRAFIFFTSSAVVIAAIGIVVAPRAVRILLGSDFHASVKPLRIMLGLVPLIAMSNVLGVQWMLPLGLERLLNRVILLAAALNVALALLLAPRYGATGMAEAVFASEAAVTIGLYVTLRIKNLNPLGHGPFTGSSPVS